MELCTDKYFYGGIGPSALSRRPRRTMSLWIEPEADHHHELLKGYQAIDQSVREIVRDQVGGVLLWRNAGLTATERASLSAAVEGDWTSDRVSRLLKSTSKQGNTTHEARPGPRVRGEGVRARWLLRDGGQDKTTAPIESKVTLVVFYNYKKCLIAFGEITALICKAGPEWYGCHGTFGTLASTWHQRLDIPSQSAGCLAARKKEKEKGHSCHQSRRTSTWPPIDKGWWRKKYCSVSAKRSWER